MARPISDNHLYEPDDCFTRHLESKYADRAMHVRTLSIIA